MGAWHGNWPHRGGRPTSLWWVHKLRFLHFVKFCIKLPQVQVELLVDKNMLMLCYSSFYSKDVDSVFAYVKV
jgi:hypothetical protein